MKSIKLIVLAVVAASLAACTGQQYTASAEYDDVYYTKADQAQPAVVSYEDDLDQRSYDERRTVTREPVDNYRDHYYEDDDFTFSRRLRRFNTASNNANWRYYDPYFSNDLYYVMGTPAWNSWNNNGWYNWNQPRFGAFYSPWNDPFNNNFSAWNRYNQWNGWNTWNSPYYNPWVNNYYGFGAGAGIGFANPYSPFGSPYFAGSAAYYCPPVGFVGGNSGWGFNNNRNTTAAAVSRPRTPRASPAARTTTVSPRNTMNNSRPAATRTRVSGTSSPRTASSDYTRPRPASARPTRVGGTSTPASTGRTSRPTTTTRPSTTQPRVYTRPSRTSSPSRVGSTPSSVRPSRSTRPSRTSSPSRVTRPSSGGGSMTTPRRSGGSLSRPSTTPSRSGSSIRSGGSRTNSSSRSSSGGSVRRK